WNNASGRSDSIARHPAVASAVSDTFRICSALMGAGLGWSDGRSPERAHPHEVRHERSLVAVERDPSRAGPEFDRRFVVDPAGRLARVGEPPEGPPGRAA